MITLSDGRTLDMRPMYISDKILIVEMQERDDEGTVLDVAKEMAAVIERGILSKSWEGSLLDVTEAQLFGITRDWAALTEDDALPPENAPDSATK